MPTRSPSAGRSPDARRWADLLTDLVAAILAAPARLGGSRLVAVDGPSGSGKTTLANRLLDALDAAGVSAVLVRTDHFATWDDPFDWWPRLESEVLGVLAAGRCARYRAMDWSDGCPLPRRETTAAPADVVVLEGVSSARRAVVDRLSLAIWVEHPNLAVRTERTVARDGEAVRVPLRGWQRSEAAWFDADGTRGRADRVLISDTPPAGA